MSYTEEDLAAWKKKYGNVYAFSARGVDYVFREITFAESDEIIAAERAEGSAAAEDTAVSLALIYPPDISMDTIPAGVVSAFAEEVLEASCFGTVPRARAVLDGHRENAGTVRVAMKAFVIAAMPAYKEEELDQLTFSELSKKVALAEQIIKVNQSIFASEGNDVRLHLIDPVEEEEKRRIEAEKHAAQKKPGQAGFDDPIAAKLAQALG